MLLNQTQVHLPMCSTANLLTPGCDEVKYSIYCRASSKKNGQLMFKRPELPNGFQGRVFFSFFLCVCVCVYFFVFIYLFIFCFSLAAFNMFSLFYFIIIFLISHQFYTHHWIHVNPSHPIQHTILPTPLQFSPFGVHMFVLYICVSTSALQHGSSVPFF